MPPASHWPCPLKPLPLQLTDSPHPTTYILSVCYVLLYVYFSERHYKKKWSCISGYVRIFSQLKPVKTSPETTAKKHVNLEINSLKNEDSICYCARGSQRLDWTQWLWSWTLLKGDSNIRHILRTFLLCLPQKYTCYNCSYRQSYILLFTINLIIYSI